jgi:hypothetical protein
MENDILTWVLAQSWVGYVTAGYVVLCALGQIASVIVPYTASTEDDKIVTKINGFLQRFVLLAPKK